MSDLKPIPQFESEDEEREFWAREDTTDYVDWSKARRVHFPNLRQTLKEVRHGLSKELLEEIELLAERQGIPVDVLIEKYLAEKIREERDATDTRIE